MNEAYKKALGRTLTHKRVQAGLTKKRLSLMVGVSRLTIRRVEQGEVNHSIDILLRITEGLGVSLADVMTESERHLRCSSEFKLEAAGLSAHASSSSGEQYFLSRF